MILTADDYFAPAPEGNHLSHRAGSGQYQLICRARQNVILEFGYFMGLLGRNRVCCLYGKEVELPSDMQGIVYIRFKESVNEVRDKIVKELKAAGYKTEV